MPPRRVSYITKKRLARAKQPERYYAPRVPNPSDYSGVSAAALNTVNQSLGSLSTTVSNVADSTTATQTQVRDLAERVNSISANAQAQGAMLQSALAAAQSRYVTLDKQITQAAMETQTATARGLNALQSQINEALSRAAEEVFIIQDANSDKAVRDIEQALQQLETSLMDKLPHMQDLTAEAQQIRNSITQLSNKIDVNEVSIDNELRNMNENISTEARKTRDILSTLDMDNLLSSLDNDDIPELQALSSPAQPSVSPPRQKPTAVDNNAFLARDIKQRLVGEIISTIDKKWLKNNYEGVFTQKRGASLRRKQDLDELIESKKPEYFKSIIRKYRSDTSSAKTAPSSDYIETITRGKPFITSWIENAKNNPVDITQSLRF